MRELFRGNLSLAAAGVMIIAAAAAASAADRFGDIVVSPQSLVSGETYHGYREVRILLENQSERDSHRVTLVFPNRSFNYGNSISRISRTVTLAPTSRAVVPLWQPPLPQNGDGRLRIEIDSQEPEFVSLSAFSQHMSRSGPRYGGASPASAILISRSLSYDEINRTFKGGATTLAATAATGAPDSASRRGAVDTAWMPDATSPGPHWLELDYDQPIRADRLRIHQTMTLPGSGEILLTGISGTNLARVPLSSVAPGARRGRSWNVQEYIFPLTAEPVKKVRIDFGSSYGGSISIDAVELAASTSGTNVWASSARASSEASVGASTGPGMPGVDLRQLLRSEVPVSEWSEYWLSYTPFDGVAVDAADMKAMSPAVMSALWRYTECGGCLIIFGQTDLPDTWQKTPAAMLPDGKRFDAGFGQCFVFNARQAGELKEVCVKLVLTAINESARTWQSLPDESSANTTFPVVANVRVPVRGIVFIMLAFVVVIGPVNLVVLSRLNRRTWLLWTIPAISAFTSVVVFAYSLLHEGITPDVRIESLTLLDQANHRAASLGMEAFYCPLTPSQGLFFGADTEATPLVDIWEYRGGSQREVDWTQAQHLNRGWVSARVPAHFQLRKSEMRRDRLQLDIAGGQLSVVNGLGVPIRSLFLADRSGRIYAATNIGAGKKAVLAPCAASPEVSDRPGLRNWFQAAGHAQLPSVNDSRTPAYLVPGSYLADLDGNPFLENGLGARAKSARTQARAVVYGILEP